MQLTESCIQFLSPIVDKDGIHTTDSKLTAVRLSYTQIYDCSLFFLGNYIAIFKNLTHTETSITLLQKSIFFIWTDAHQHNVDTVKNNSTHAPTSVYPYYTLPFSICTDASFTLVPFLWRLHNSLTGGLLCLFTTGWHSSTYMHSPYMGKIPIWFLGVLLL